MDVIQEGIIRDDFNALIKTRSNTGKASVSSKLAHNPGHEFVLTFETHKAISFTPTSAIGQCYPVLIPYYVKQMLTSFPKISK